jgi:hypothetical protein
MEHNDKVIKLGRHISIGDPAYFNDLDLLVKAKVKAGYYVAWSEESDFGFFGKRTGRMMAYHNQFLKRFDAGTTEFYWEHIGDIPVDTATASIFNENEIPFTADFKDTEDAFSSHTGIGDGYYPVYACYEKKQIVGIMVDFTFDDEEEVVDENLEISK